MKSISKIKKVFTYLFISLFICLILTVIFLVHYNNKISIESSNFQDRYDALVRENEALESINSGLKSKIKELESSACNSNKNTSSKELTSLTEENKDLKEKINNLEEENTHLHEQIHTSSDNIYETNNSNEN
ncbi:MULTISPECIES: hypothetical protein [unclassified Romboutsia]|uniref:hypothetical protein n=1 Tax=unclassified Romboutsia TaxID=2626894 RepID=UPI000822AD28|nr:MULTISPECIES: hypothetical protein [unclassified Romboutsia]SCH05062.1 Uncharacterised protein [uncultured Clostridium sp.]